LHKKNPPLHIAQLPEKGNETEERPTWQRQQGNPPLRKKVGCASFDAGVLPIGDANGRCSALSAHATAPSDRATSTATAPAKTPAPHIADSASPLEFPALPSDAAAGSHRKELLSNCLFHNASSPLRVHPNNARFSTSTLTKPGLGSFMLLSPTQKSPPAKRKKNLKNENLRTPPICLHHPMITECETSSPSHAALRFTCTDPGVVT
jgi:hypothetical protein